MSNDSALSLVKREIPLDDDALHALVTSGNLARLTIQQQTQYYRYRCQQAGLDPSTKPFDILTLNGKVVLYATKECAAQLCSLHRLSAEVRSTKSEDGSYEVTARVISPDGRFTDDIGAISIKGLSGDALSNAKMKATTKAKRRATLTHCGLGMMDESEVEGIHAGWGGTGSRAEQQEAARRKIAELQGSVTPAEAVTEGAGVDVSAPALDIPDDPLETPTQAPKAQGKANARKQGASGKVTKNFGWLQEIRTYKDVLCAVGCEADYYKLLESFGIKHSNELTVPEDQQKLLKAVRILALECESKAAGGKLYSNPKWVAVFADEQAAIRTANFAYAVGRKAKNPIEQVDAICEEQLLKGWTSGMITQWWDARNLEVKGKA